MPFKYIKRFTEECKLGLWEIEEDYDQLKSMVVLDSDEKEILHGFKSISRRKEYLSVRVLLQRMGKRDMRILYGKRNKPFLAGNTYHISISHSANLTGIYLSSKFHVGLDLELMSHRINRIAHKFINPAEYITKDPLLQKYHLYIHWCAKEALFKLLDKEGLNFREHMIISPFSPQEEGKLSGSVNNETIDASFDLWYYRLGEYVVVWSNKIAEP